MKINDGGRINDKSAWISYNELIKLMEPVRKESDRKL